MATKTLSADEVTALFSGTLTRPTAPKRLVIPTRPVVRRYDRCMGHGEITAALLTFSGATDWAPDVPIDDPVRDYIDHLRKATGKRTILLCSTCVEANRQYRPATPPVVERVRLFEL